MKGYGIEIKNNLLEPKHVKAMGSSLWEYLWILDRVTRIDDDGIGHVYGGAPVKLEAINKDLGLHATNISKNLTKLMKEGYINTVRTPYGIKISVNKAFKRFSNNTKLDLAKTHRDLAKTSNVIKTITKDNNKESIYNSISYLKDLPLEDIDQLSATYQATKQQVREKAEAVVLYCESRGTKYKNYRSTLQAWLLRDYGKRTSNGYTRI